MGTDADAGVCCLQDVAIGFSLNKMSLYMAYRLEWVWVVNHAQ